MSVNPAHNPTILLRNIETLGIRFRKEHLGIWDIPRLELDWFYALDFLLGRNFMRGRNDELSNVFLSFTIDRLHHLLHPSDRLGEAYSILKEHYAKGQLDSSTILGFKKRHEMKGTANSITHEAFGQEIAATNPVVKLLTTTCDVTVKWPSEYQKATCLNNERDLMMVMDTLQLVCQPDCQNIYVYLVKQIKAGHTKTAYKILDDLSQVGDKLASMTIRDICMMQPGLILEDSNDVFPVDIWVRRIAEMLGCDAKKASGIKLFFQERCTEYGIDITLFAAGMWYLGANSLTILVNDFIGAYEIPAVE